MRKELIIEKKFAGYMQHAYGDSVKYVTMQEMFEIKQAFMMGAAAMSSQYVERLKGNNALEDITNLITSHTPYFSNFAEYNPPPENIAYKVQKDKWNSN